MKILFGSDVSGHVGSKNYELFAQKKTKEIFNGFIDLFKEADATIVNLECAVTDSEHKIKKFGPNLKMPITTAEVLKDAGIDYVGISNNHLYDYGRPGYYDTLKYLDAAGIKYTGVGENVEDARKDLILTDGKVKVAVIAVCEHEYTYALENREGCREYDPYDTSDDIVEAKKNADFVVVMYHGGKEHSRYPSPRLIKACRSMIKHGADLVLCQHTHCIGCYEEFQGGHILYGQGNFVFCEEDKTDMWNTFLLVKAEFTDKVKVEFIPGNVVDGKAIDVANDAEKERLLKELEERSKSLQDGTWKEGWDAFCKSVGWYKFIPENIVDLFSHYLDCEAHSDVWRHIYKTWNWTNELVDEEYVKPDLSKVWEKK